MKNLSGCMADYKARYNTPFLKMFNQLPHAARKVAERKLDQWTRNNHHPGLHFKKLRTHSGNHFSIRISETGPGYRAVGILIGDLIEWFWIGPHDEYEILLKKL